MLHDDGSESGKVTFEGSFNWAGNDHTIQLPLNYHTARQDGDPTLSRRILNRGTPIVHRRSDIMSPAEARDRGILLRGEANTGCSADSHEFNSQNALFLTKNNNDAHSFSPMSFFAPSMNSGQLSARSLFPMLRGRAADFFRDPKTTIAPDQSFPYNDITLLRRQDTGNDIGGGSANSSFIGDIGSTSGCPAAARVVYMGVASDCSYTGRFSNSSDARTTLLNNMNVVSNIYRSTFRLSLGVVQLEVREADSCSSATTGADAWNSACSNTFTLDERLSSFSQWRGQQSSNGAGLWHLFTTCSTGSEVGVAWLGTLCKETSSGQGSDVISGTGVTGATTNEAQISAHEIGHNFGAIHDCISGCSISGSTAINNGGAVCCPLSSTTCNTNGDYIMSPVSQTDTQIFSPCSIGNICTMLGGGINTTCVVDPTVDPRETLSVQQCGNGILEPGEECDAGINGSNCCSTSCKLTSGSVCDPETSSCCTNSCQFASASTVCRTAVDERCDTAETCTGNNATCPVDFRKENGASCGDGLSCATGHCTSRNLQCQEQSQSGMTFTSACPANTANSCSISCQSPSNGASCLILQSQFIDGTSCGYGGTCLAGECKSGNWQSTFQNWYRDNLNIAIPVTIVIAVIIFALLYCIVKSCLRRSQQGKNKKAIASQQPSSRWSSNDQPNYSNNAAYRAPPPPPPPPQNTWVNPQDYNGHSHQHSHSQPNTGYPSYQ